MRLSESGKNESIKNVAKKFLRYWHHVHPNVLDPEDYYWYAYTPEQKKAMLFLRDTLPEPDELLKKGWQLTVQVRSVWNKRDFIQRPSLTMKWQRDDFPWPSMIIEDADITDPIKRKKLIEWTVRACQFEALLRHLRSHAREMLHGIGAPHYGLNTPGQMFRVWPEFAAHAIPKYTQKIASQKLKSALPKDWTEKDLDAFRKNPYMDELNHHLLAMSVMDVPTHHEHWYHL